ncbi:hypothetical protein [Pseudobdellovibrio exovorus]|uniref:Glycoamylase-like domain-containing protein n=1 Tax=Pseudobdellovibrio exovorus JSS TaxID=1184267 RepID=M4VBQ4_9BACT|nr:hypothetical protein [Pseudobdellovibrio exovorus]AGH95456.1 hypothetical protein A11Q_1240 [Pseudobdellovibrio exovorus JSS]
MKLASYVIILTYFFSFSAHSQMRSSSHIQTDAQIARHLFYQSLKFYNQEFRHPVSGQYVDATSLLAGSVQENNSSVAATGMGVAMLALADAAGKFDNNRKGLSLDLRLDLPLDLQNYLSEDFEAQAYHSLRTVLDPQFSRRHPQWGWFRHWFRASDGADNNGSRGDGYSTIDTAILAAGALLAGNYFEAREGHSSARVKELAERLLQTVNWESAIADINFGRLYLNYNLESGRALGATSKFNEYILVACMGKVAEQKAGRVGRMTQFWNRHFADLSGLPKRSFMTSNGRQISLLTDSPFQFLSSFTMQFAYYLCGSINNNPSYVQYFKNAMEADRAWFAQQRISKSSYWGAGAGEALNFKYAANAIGRNPDLIVSPHIIAGFLSESPELVRDLATIYRDKQCVYRKNETEVLWRCSLTQPEQRLNRLQAIDFSSMFLGLATVHPNIGRGFFKSYAP